MEFTTATTDNTWASLGIAIRNQAGFNSTTDGYTSGGYDYVSYIANIQQVNFTSQLTDDEWSMLSDVSGGSFSGCNSRTAGYTNRAGTIDEVDFSTTTNDDGWSTLSDTVSATAAFNH